MYCLRSDLRERTTSRWGVPTLNARQHIYFSSNVGRQSASGARRTSLDSLDGFELSVVVAHVTCNGVLHHASHTSAGRPRCFRSIRCKMFDGGFVSMWRGGVCTGEWGGATEYRLCGRVGGCADRVRPASTSGVAAHISFRLHVLYHRSCGHQYHYVLQ